MPNRQRYDFPHEQLRALGLQARREDLTFEDFWERSVRPGTSPVITTESARTVDPPFGAVVWPKDSADRANAMAAIRGTQEGWRRAYEGVPPNQGEIALSMLNALAVEAAGGLAIGDAVPLAA